MADKPKFQNHADEIAWHLANRHGGPEVQCASCEHRTMGYTCSVCEDEYQEASRYGRMPLPDVLCADCAVPCRSCHRPTCEHHARASGECIGCSGPTDAEQQADGGICYYSSERMAAMQREIL